MTSDPRRFKRMLNNMQSGFQSGITSMQSTIQNAQRQGNSTFYTASIQQQKSQKCGWLRKQGGVVKSWHRRWFTIKGDHMYYFQTDDESKAPLGFIFLPGNKVTEQTYNNNEPDKYIFEIIAGGDKSRMTTSHETYPLAAASDDERKDWVRLIRRVMYAEKGGAIFGQRLSETMKFDYMKSQRKIPQIVDMCVDYLTKYGIELEGIFRLPGRTALIRQVREKFDCGERPNFEDLEVDVNTVASLFKQYLRELPEPIIPTDMYEPVMKAVIRDMPIDRENGLQNLIAVLKEMPSYNYNLLQYICRFLSEIHNKSEVNKMNDANLATVFAQSIIRPEDDDPALLMGTAGNRSQVVLVLIQEVHNIFKIEYTPEGTSVMVDNLLDIDDPVPVFNAEAMSYYSLPKSTSLDSDLLSLDLSTSESIDSLPEPIFPINQGSDVNIQEMKTVHYSHTEKTVKQTESGYTVTSSSTTKCLGEVMEEFDEDEEDSESEEEDELPLFGSVRASVLQNHKNPRSHKSNSLESKPIANHVNRSNSLDSKATPIPPPRPSKRLTTGTSNDSINKSATELDKLDGDNSLDELLNTDLTDQSRDDLLTFIQTLFTELKSQRSKVKDLNIQMLTMKGKHQEQTQKLAEKIDQERNATARAVEKVMSVQNELQEYHMRYSKLMDDE